MRKRQTKNLVVAIFFLVVLGAAYFSYATTLAVSKSTQPVVRAVLANPNPKFFSLVWPQGGQAVVGTKDMGILDSKGTPVAVPCASTAKIITAYMILKQKPLQPGQDGPLITLTQQDVNFYQQYVAEDGSVVPVAAGEQISEYQALQALLLPSANNMANSLAVWAYGSVDNFLAAANKEVKVLGMANTHLADPSGFSPNTTSSANDLFKIAVQAMDNPVFAGIVSQKQAIIPEAGPVDNVNFLLGQDGIIGIKTGNTDQAGGVFVFAGKKPGAQPDVTVIGAVAGAPNLQAALMSSHALLNSAYKNFSTITYIKKGQSLGYYTTPWGQRTDMVADQDATLTIWNNSAVSLVTNLHSLAIPSKAGTQVGTATLKAGQTRLTITVSTENAITKPSVEWRLTHPTGH